MTARAFASAAMLALIADGLARQGIALPGPRPRGTGPTVPHDDKRQLLDAVLAAHGGVALLRIGEAIPAHRFEPMLHVLLRADGPADLLQRWLRLEGYAHSHHRTRIEKLEAGAALLRHVALHGPPPSPAEDLLVLGVQVGLLRLLGCADVTARFGTASAGAPDGGWLADAVAGAVAAGATATWRIAWSAPARREARPASSGVADELGFAEGTEAAALAAMIADDPARRWSVADAAAALGLGARALQRRLAARGLTTTAVARAVQVRAACLRLADGDDPLPAIGFACGFSDQAHFTREFRRRVNMPPGRYRALRRPTSAAVQAAP
jgi:AraC-like DNA-binding protein